MAANPDKAKAGAKKRVAKRPVKKKVAAKSKANVADVQKELEGISLGEKTPETPKPAAPTPTVVPSVSAVTAAVSTRTARSVRERDITAFLRQLIMMLEAGTPLLKTLKSLSNRGETASIRNMVAGMSEYVEAGNPLWQAFAREERAFGPVSVNLIKASEASGTLTTALKRLITHRTRREMLLKRVRGAMLYPVVLISFCFAVIVGLAKFVLPEFKAIFDGFGVELGPFSKGFMGASDFVSAWWWVAILLAAAFIAGYKFWWVRGPLRRLATDRLKLRLPIVGYITRRNVIVEFTRTFALLLRSGLSMLVTLDLCRDAVGNRAMVEAIQDMRDSVERGEGLERPLRTAERKGVFPGVVVDMLVTGEDSGAIDVVADQVADIYEEEVDIAVDTIGDAIQPVLTIFMGAIVAVIAVALFGPLVEMIERISEGGL